MRNHRPLKRALVVLVLVLLATGGCVRKAHRETLERIENYYGAQGVRPGSMPLLWDVPGGKKYNVDMPEDLR